MWDKKAIGKEGLKKLHNDMHRSRLIEETIAELYPEQEMRCPVHLSIGQDSNSCRRVCTFAYTGLGDEHSPVSRPLPGKGIFPL